MARPRKRPHVDSEGQRELAQVEKQFDAFEEQVTSLTLDAMNKAPKLEIEPQTKIAQNDLSKNEIYLKPIRAISSKEKFNDRFRSEYDFAKQYVAFTAENNEVIGETLDFWTKPFPGLPAEEWKVPTNKVVWGPRYVAEQIKGCKYHKMSMDQTVTENSSVGKMYGSMVVDNVVQRIDAHPVDPTRKSVFMSA